MIVQAFLEAVDELGIIDDLALAAGIGCSAWIPVYMHVDVLKVLHGRAIPAAIGLKVTRPSRKVVVFTGDGDGLAIGASTCSTPPAGTSEMGVVMVNNQIYAMTGGQVAPSTRWGPGRRPPPTATSRNRWTAARSPSRPGPPSSAAGQRPIPRRSAGLLKKC